MIYALRSTGSESNGKIKQEKKEIRKKREGEGSFASVDERNNTAVGSLAYEKNVKRSDRFCVIYARANAVTGE